MTRQQSKKLRKRKSGKFSGPKKCVSGKPGYDTEEAAQFFAKADGLRPYECSLCTQWHLSGQTRAKRPENRQRLDQPGAS